MIPWLEVPNNDQNGYKGSMEELSSLLLGPDDDDDDDVEGEEDSVTELGEEIDELGDPDNL